MHGLFVRAPLKRQRDFEGRFDVRKCCGIVAMQHAELLQLLYCKARSPTLRL
jgi:hypothetical protein